ncbi:MAG: hypothetical protein JNJ54_12595 [Myxococcaceae bacterium]|nr:hypothetical protein [Myxococcaceae bacterium]
MAADTPTRLGHASPLLKARVGKKDPARVMGFVEQTTLFVVALKKERATELLEAFGQAHRQRARVFAQQLADLDSPTRQARLALEFGPRDGLRERVERLLSSSPPALRAALCAQLPPAFRPASPPAATPVSPALKALAARLVRETLR